MSINGRALAVASTGILFIWSGIKGWSVLATIGDVLTGKKPNEPVSYPVSIGSKASSGVTGNASGIAGIAQQYVGHAYLFGGAPGKDGTQPWDCSSFVNWVCSVKAGLAIPGYGPGKYDGSTHGPTTTQWAVWPGMTTVKRADVQASDIIVWATHMGIAVSNSQYISAHSPAERTTVTNIPTSGLGPIVRIGRL